MHESVIKCLIIKSPRWKWGVDIINVLTMAKVIFLSVSCINLRVWVSLYWRMWVIKQLTVAIDFHCILFHTLEVNGYQLFGYQYSSKYIFVFNRTKKNSYRFGTTWRWVKSWQDFLFWVNYPFNSHRWSVSHNALHSHRFTPISLKSTDLSVYHLSERVISGQIYILNIFIYDINYMNINIYM